MGLRGRKALPTEIKISQGTLQKSREIRRLALDKIREMQREQELEDRRFVRGIVAFFMEEPVEEAWLEDALRRDANKLGTRLWRAYGADFREEYSKRYPGETEPAWWKKYKRQDG